MGLKINENARNRLAFLFCFKNLYRIVYIV